MERRRAIAWAGSIALMGCATTLVVGSLLGGFGMGISPAPQPQAIGPESKPQATGQTPVPDTPQDSPLPDVFAPDPPPGHSKPVAASDAAPPASGVRPVSDALVDTKDDPRPAFVPDSPEIVVVSPNVITGSQKVLSPSRGVDRRDNPAGKKKAPAPIFDKRSNRDAPMTDGQRRPAELARLRDILERMPGSKVGRVGPLGQHDLPVSDRGSGSGTKAGAAGHHPRGRKDGRDG
ncbi:MAG: hypothetical protein M3300_08645 [Actinomycetota bacterium]|nr:hypothetical protein [Actinomycetota bacterium]